MSYAGESGGASGIYVFTDDGSPASLYGAENEVIMFNGGEPVTVSQSSLSGIISVPEGVTVGSGVGASFNTIYDAVQEGYTHLHIIGPTIEAQNITGPTGLVLVYHNSKTYFINSSFVFSTLNTKDIYICGKGELEYEFTSSNQDFLHGNGQLGTATVDGVDIRMSMQGALSNVSFSRGNLRVKNLNIFTTNNSSGRFWDGGNTKVNSLYIDDVVMSGGGTTGPSPIITNTIDNKLIVNRLETIGTFGATVPVITVSTSTTDGILINNLAINSANGTLRILGGVTNNVVARGISSTVNVGGALSNIDVGSAALTTLSSNTSLTNVRASGQFAITPFTEDVRVTNCMLGSKATPVVIGANSTTISNSLLRGSIVQDSALASGLYIVNSRINAPVTLNGDYSRLSNCEIVGDLTFGASSSNCVVIGCKVYGTVTDNGANNVFVDFPLSIDDLSDVDITTSAPTLEDSLVWDGNNFVPSGVTGGASGPTNWEDIGNVGDVDYIPLNSGTAAPVHGEGRVFYDQNEHALSYYNDEVDVTLQVGQENYVRVYNETGATLTNGTLVYTSGAETTEGRPAVGLASSSSSSTAAVIGWTTHDIENETYGYVTSYGLVNNVNLDGVAPGTPLYLSSTPGGFTASTPADGEIEVIVGYSITSGTADRLLVNIRAGLNLAIGDASQIIVPAEKGSPGTINIGEAVYVTGWNNGAGRLQVELADASSAATMPAFGIARDSIAQNIAGDIIVNGNLGGLNTSAYSEGDNLYISETAGQLTDIKPVGATLIQKVAIVARSNASNGIIQVFGAGRSNDLPNLPSGYIWAGGTDGAPVEFASGAEGTYLSITNGSPSWVTVSAGAGDVAGPGSSTDNAIARYDGTTGKIIQNSEVRVSDSGSIENPRVVIFRGEVNNGNSGAGTFNVNWNQGQKQSIRLTGNPTLTFTNPPGIGNFLLRLEQDATGNREPTWPTGVRWRGNNAPNLTNTGGRSDIVSFYFNGLYYYAVSSLNYFA